MKNNGIIGRLNLEMNNTTRGVESKESPGFHPSFPPPPPPRSFAAEGFPSHGPQNSP